MLLFPISQLQTPAPPQQTNPKQQLLAQMKDVVTPEAVGIWPPAPGWWVVAALLCSAILLMIYYGKRHYRARRYRQLALAELQALAQRANKLDDNEFAAAINALLKKTAFCAYPHSRDALAGLYGRQWQACLDKVLRKPFSQTLANSWTDAIYHAPATADTPDKKIARKPLLNFAEHWIKQHRVLTPDQLRTVLNNVRSDDSSNTQHTSGLMEASHV